VKEWRRKDNAETQRALRFAEKKEDFTTEFTEGTEKRGITWLRILRRMWLWI
jgi:hypothetical protein